MTERIAGIPWFSPEMTGDELAQLKRVLDSGFVNDGPVTKRFETEIARIAGTRFAVAVTSGTIAIFSALAAVGVRSGDEVLVPALTFIATANAVRLTGATPVLVDIEPERFAIDPEAALAALTPRTRAIVTVDVNGRGAAYDRIEPLCERHDLLLVTDSAEGLGSHYRGRPLGSFGQAGCFSFSPNKFVTTGQGGVVTTNDEALYHRLLEIKDQGRPVRGTGGDDMHPSMGFNFKFTDLQAAVGLAQLGSLDARVEAARRRDALYQEYLGNVQGVRLGAMQEKGEARLWADALIERRDAVAAAFAQAGIGFRNFWHPINVQRPYQDQRGPFPVAEKVSRQGMWLPSHFAITVAEMERTARVLRDAVAAL
jgi:perosamine synthetase